MSTTMSTTMSITATLLLSTSIAVAVYLITASIRGHTVLSMDHEMPIYVAGIILTVTGLLAVTYQLTFHGPGIMPGTLFTLSLLNAFRLLEDLRQYVPIGWPWGYQGG